MGLTLDRGRYYFVLNVPKELYGKILGPNGTPVRQIRTALKTSDKTVAKRKAFELEELKRAEWQLLALGQEDLAYQKYEAAKEVAKSHGFDYVPADMLLSRGFEANLSRLKVIAQNPNTPAPLEVTQALLGDVPVAYPPLSKVLDEYMSLVQTKHLRKSERQKHLWKLPRHRAVDHFFKAVPERKRSGVDQITRDDALKFRDWWAKRIAAGTAKAETANKDFGVLSQLMREWAELKGHNDLQNPFTKLRFDTSIDADNTRPPFSRDWVKDKLLAPNALATLNQEAADVLLMLVNTALRPSEILSCPLEDFCLEEEIPFIRIAPHGRELKQKHTARELPLLGVSLRAAERIVARGGITRYFHKSGSWSAVVNKYLEAHGLKETPAHSAYSLRHYVEDALLEAGVDDRVRADILGHKYARPNYGSGGGLKMRKKALELIAL